MPNPINHPETTNDIRQGYRTNQNPCPMAYNSITLMLFIGSLPESLSTQGSVESYTPVEHPLPIMR